MPPRAATSFFVLLVATGPLTAAEKKLTFDERVEITAGLQEGQIIVGE